MQVRIWHRESGKLSKATRDTILLFLFLCLIPLVFIQLDLFDRFIGRIPAAKIFKLDELILAIAFLSVFFLFYAIRRWLDQRKILIQLNEERKKLEEVNLQLSYKAEELEKHGIRNDRLGRLATYLQVCTSRNEIYQIVGESAGSLFPDSRGALYITKESRNQLNLAAQWGEGKFTDYFQPEDCWGLRLGKDFYSGKGRETPRCGHSGDTDGTNICIPLTAHGEVIGLFHIQFPPGFKLIDGVLPPLTRQSLSIFTDQVSLAIANLTLHEQLKDLAIHDPLTGLFNRQYLNDILERELHRAKRKDGTSCILMLDIDHFKVFNDTFGHSAGDAVLKELGRHLKNFFRIEDFCCRYGGEEFLILISDTELEGIEERFETLRKSIHAINVIFQGSSLGTIAVSMGASLFPKDGTTPERLIEAADKALYRAKNEGRNRICFS